MLSTAVLMAASMVAGQAEEPNVEYEKLKLLMPAMGDWGGVRELPSGGTGETMITFSFLPGNKIIRHDIRNRWAKPNEDIAKKEWYTRRHALFIWNPQKKPIEEHQFDVRSGRASVVRWTPKGDGVFALDLVSSTREGEKGGGDIKMTFSSDRWTMETTNRKDPDGNALDDTEFSWSRMNQAGVE